MARGTRVRIEGLRELEAGLENLTKRTGKAAILRGMKNAMKPMRDLAKSYAPYEYGGLEKSIIMTTKRPADYQDPGKAAYAEAMRSGATRAQAGAALRSAVAGSGGIIELFMGPNRHPKAVQTEFGNRHQQADPYMRPAFDAEGRPTFERLAEEIRREIEKSASRAAARAARKK